MKQLLLAACCLFLAVPPSAAAIYRCTQKAVVNRDTRGDDPVSKDALPKAGSPQRRIMVNEAIANGEPLIGMTRAELDQAVGKPGRTKIDNTYNRDNKELQKKLGKQLDDAPECQA